MTTIRERFADERRGEIAAAAMSLFVRNGITQTTMQEIAAEVGLSAGALYRYFPSKDELAEAVFSVCCAENEQLFEAAIASEGAPLETLVAMGNGAWQLFEEPDRLERFAMNLETILASYRESLAIRERWVSVVHRGLEATQQLIERGQAAGEIDPSIDARNTAVALVAIHSGLQNLILQLGDEVDARGAFEAAITMLRRLAPAGSETAATSGGGTDR